MCVFSFYPCPDSCSRETASFVHTFTLLTQTANSRYLRLFLWSRLSSKPHCEWHSVYRVDGSNEYDRLHALRAGSDSVDRHAIFVTATPGYQ